MLKLFELENLETTLQLQQKKKKTVAMLLGEEEEADFPARPLIYWVGKEGRTFQLGH